ncbi:DUF7688 family protein [Azospirillum sp. sgz302134]
MTDSRYQILVNGKPALFGDAGSVGVVFNNLTGVNFQDAPCQFGGHAAYLRYMGHAMLDDENGLVAGTELAVRAPDGATVARHVLGDPAPARLRLSALALAS